MVSKKILGAAIAVALSSQAFAAATNLSSGTAPTALKIAKQAITTTAETAAGSGWYHVTDGAAIDFDIVSKLGIGLAVDQKIYIKVKLTNAKFDATVTTGMLAVTDNNTAGTAVVNTVAQGGAVGDDYVIFTVSPASGHAFFIGDTATLDTDALQVNGASVTATVTTYDSVASAVAGTNVLYTANGSGGSLITFPADAVTAATSATSTVTASVADLFKKFTTQGGVVSGANLVAQLGQLSTTLASYADIDGTAITLADVVNTATSTVKYKGDFSVGTWYASDDAVGTTKTALTLNADKTEATIALSALAAKPYLLVVENGTTQIPVSSYTADVTFTAPANGAMGAVTADTGNVSGSIVRDGTTLNVPYITINPQYKQRFVIANSSAADAVLTVGTITPEVGTTTATDLIGATGVTLPAGKTTVVQMSSLIGLSDSKTRARATFNVSAPSAKVDATTTTVNTTDSSTDTVIIQKN